VSLLADLVATVAEATPDGGGRDWLAFCVAVYGAVIATGVAVYQFVRDRPGVKVFLETGRAIGKTGKAFDFWLLRVVNHRKRAITIRRAGLTVKDHRWMPGKFMSFGPGVLERDGSHKESPFPVILGDGEALEIWLDAAHGGKVVKAFAVDASDRTYVARYPRRRSLKEAIGDWISVRKG
jgi:hypothetical protein